jgi:hypothetical protein
MNEDMMKRIMSKEEQLRLAAIIKAERHRKLYELGHMIRGTSYTGTRPGPETKGASGAGTVINDKKKVTVRIHPILSEKQKKLRELGKMIKD